MFQNWYVPKLYYAFFKEWFLNDVNSQTNQRKNLLAMQQICANRGIPFYALDSATDLMLDRAARDLAHPGIDSNFEFAAKMHKKITNNN
jgi:hypothetical protein